MSLFHVPGVNFSVGLYVLASLPFFLDLMDLMLRLYLRRGQTLPMGITSSPATSIPLNVGEFTPYEMRLHLRPYAIAVSVYKSEDTIGGFIEAMAPFRDRLWFIDDASGDGTPDRLEQLGARCVRGVVNCGKPGALKALVAQLPPEIVTVIVLDPDCKILTSRAEFERVLFQFQRTGMAALCPRLAVRVDGWLTQFQELEYWLAFSLGRKSLADFSITSGAAIYRRDALESTLAQHSLSVYAEDLENSFILLSNGERVYYDGRLVVETEGMPSCRRLFSQRVGWHFGLLRVYAERCASIARCARQSFVFQYQFIVYIGVFVLLLHPLKLLGLPLLILSGLKFIDALAGTNLMADATITHPLYFIALYIKYTALMLVIIPLAVGRPSRKRAFLVAPAYTFYALAQVIPATVGYANWISMRLWGRRVYRDHYEPAAP